jgi:WD40 repeat protein
MHQQKYIKDLTSLTAVAPGTCMCHLQSELRPDVMLPARRLEALVEQAVSSQFEVCAPMDNRTRARISLFSDVAPSLPSLPIECSQVLLQHSGQVWNARFSPDGTMVASGCQDGQLHLWKVCSS